MASHQGDTSPPDIGPVVSAAVSMLPWRAAIRCRSSLCRSWRAAAASAAKYGKAPHLRLLADEPMQQQGLPSHSRVPPCKCAPSVAAPRQTSAASLFPRHIRTIDDCMHEPRDTAQVAAHVCTHWPSISRKKSSCEKIRTAEVNTCRAMLVQGETRAYVYTLAALGNNGSS